MTEAEKIEAITKVLHKDWDPIGCGVPEDEYESYAPRVVRIIEEARDALPWREGRDMAIAQVTAYLSYVRIVTIGLQHESRTRDARGALACVNALYPRS